MEPITATVTKVTIGVATKYIFEKILSTSWPKDLMKGRDIIKKLYSEECFQNYLEKYVSRVIKIRTIHSSESDTLLNEIYHPLSINGSRSDELCVGDGFVISNNEITNIIGIAGQGKSTILRKMFIEQIKNGEKIPFFMELRKVEGIGIKKYLNEILLDCGVTTSDEKIIQLLESNKIILMLDGFDEISSNLSNNILSEITSIHKSYNTQIITTTRPHTLICTEPNITNYNVQFLVKDDIVRIIEKLNVRSAIEDDLMPSLFKTLEVNKNLSEVMNTPILVTLFYICYPYLDAIPDNAVDFYSNLFTTLYLRHDKVKNFVREKSCSMGYKDAFECFNTLCFMSINENVLEFSEVSLNRYVQIALELCGKLDKDNTPDDFASDIINITCLIQKDGYDRYVFLHKSIQEYHAAEFIKNLEVGRKVKFYELMTENISEDPKFANVLRFLMETDGNNLIKLMVIPLCQKFGIDKWEKPSEEKVSELYDELCGSLYASMEIETKHEVMGEFGDNEVVSFKGMTLPFRRHAWVNIFLGEENYSIGHLDNCVITPLIRLTDDSSLKSKLLLDAIKSESSYDSEGVEISLLDVYSYTKKTDIVKEDLKKVMIMINKVIYLNFMSMVEKNDNAMRNYFDFLK